MFNFILLFGGRGERVTLCSPCCPRTHRELPASASQVSELVACATMPASILIVSATLKIFPFKIFICGYS